MMYVMGQKTKQVEHGDQQHDQAGAGVAEDEFVNAERAEQNSANTGWNFVGRPRCDGGRRRRNRRRNRFQFGGKFSKRTQRLPFRGTFRLSRGLGVDTVLGNPTPDFLRADRAVGPSVRSDDFIHNAPFWFRFFL